jgi:chemotaxis protein CheX
VRTEEELIGLFVECVTTALREMAGVEVVLRHFELSRKDEVLSRIAAILPVNTSIGVGQLTLDISKDTALAITRRTVSQEHDTAMVLDLMGEIVNVIAGQAKARLFGTPKHFTLSTPTVEMDSQIVLRAGLLVLEFDSDVGGFKLYLDV